MSVRNSMTDEEPSTLYNGEVGETSSGATRVPLIGADLIVCS